MELRQIQYFIQLYKDRNITKASKNLFISQQGLSKSMGKLEEELGLVLFERNAQGVIPTEEAELLHDYFEKVVGDYDSLLEQADYLKGKRNLKVIAPEGFAMSCDKKEFMRYAKENPDIDLIYEEVSHDMIPDLLEAGEAEIAFMKGMDFPKVKREVVFDREPLCALMSTRHPLAGKKQIMVRELHGATLLLMKDYDEYEKWIKEEIQREKINCRILSKKVSSNLYLHYILDSSYIGIVERSRFRYYRHQGFAFIPLLDSRLEEMEVETALVTSGKGEVGLEGKNYIDFNLRIYSRLNKDR